MKTITIPLGRRKKKKIYCKRCKWGGDDDYNCYVYETINNHISKNHRIRTHSFKREKQNENNDCEFFKSNFWWFI